MNSTVQTILDEIIIGLAITITVACLLLIAALAYDYLGDIFIESFTK